MITGDEHIAEAQSCLRTAHWPDGEGKRWQASEILWSAVKHSVSAVAILTEQEYGKYQHKRAVVRRSSSDGDQNRQLRPYRIFESGDANTR